MIERKKKVDGKLTRALDSRWLHQWDWLSLRRLNIALRGWGKGRVSDQMNEKKKRERLQNEREKAREKGGKLTRALDSRWLHRWA